MQGAQPTVGQDHDHRLAGPLGSVPICNRDFLVVAELMAVLVRN